MIAYIGQEDRPQQTLNQHFPKRTSHFLYVYISEHIHDLRGQPPSFGLSYHSYTRATTWRATVLDRLKTCA